MVSDFDGSDDNFSDEFDCERASKIHDDDSSDNAKGARKQAVFRFTAMHGVSAAHITLLFVPEP